MSVIEVSETKYPRCTVQNEESEMNRRDLAFEMNVRDLAFEMKCRRECLRCSAQNEEFELKCLRKSILEEVSEMRWKS